MLQSIGFGPIILRKDHQDFLLADYFPPTPYFVESLSCFFSLCVDEKRSQNLAATMFFTLAWIYQRGGVGPKTITWQLLVISLNEN